ncbi:MAG: PDZ domain-containing protein [Longimicrobiaceae bacterium]
MRIPRLLLAAALAAPSALAGQARRLPPVDYQLRVDSALAGWTVEMHVHEAPATLRVAMMTHPEYDERFYRYVRDFGAWSPAGPLPVAREDSTLWRIGPTGGGDVVIRYRIELPPPAGGVRGSWIPFLAPTGGLIGGPHSFMYVVGGEAAPARVELRLPQGWTAAMGVSRLPGLPVFDLPDAATLLDTPVLVGRLRTWSFEVDGVPHEVAYWPRPDAVPFDTAALVDALRGIVTQASALFGGLPYRQYAFLLQDGAYGGLEHASSTTIGAPSEELAGDRSNVLLDVAHEYFHAWNLVRLRPAGWGGLTWQPPGRTRELWWSEGVTMYYADLLLRRAGLVTTPRLDVLGDEAARYLDNPGHARISPEQAGWTADDQPGANGDFSADHYMQGKLIATVLDLAIRDSTAGRRSLDDVMRALVAEHPQPAGYTGMDIERTASRVCGCQLHGFFERHVRGSTLLDFAPALRPLGLRPRVWMEPVRDSAGRAQPDLRVWVFTRRGEREPRFIIDDPRSTWARAGLHTGDVIVSINGAAIPDRRAAITAIRALRTGGRARVELVRDGRPMTVEVAVGDYERTRVAFEDLPTVTPAQRAARARWLAAAP